MLYSVAVAAPPAPTLKLMARSYEIMMQEEIQLTTSAVGYESVSLVGRVLRGGQRRYPPPYRGSLCVMVADASLMSFPLY